jgi:hypothetical protein
MIDRKKGLPAIRARASSIFWQVFRHLFQPTNPLARRFDPSLNPAFHEKARQIVTNSTDIISSVNSIAGKSHRVLIFTKRGWPSHLAWETIIGLGLRLRGSDCHYFLCSGGLPICENLPLGGRNSNRCYSCFGRASKFLDVLELPYSQLSDYLSVEDIERISSTVVGDSVEDLENFTVKGIPVGKWAQLSSCRHLGIEVIPEQGYGLEVYRDFVSMGAMIVEAGESLLDEIRPDRLLVLNGLFLSARIMVEIANRRGIPVTIYERGRLTDTIGCAHNEPIGWANMDNLGLGWRDYQLNDEENMRLDEYLKDRRTGKHYIINLWPNVLNDKEAILGETGLIRDRPTLAVFSNVVWDSSVLERDIAFEGIFHWLTVVIDHVSTLPEISTRHCRRDFMPRFLT